MTVSALSISLLWSAAHSLRAPAASSISGLANYRHASPDDGARYDRDRSASPRRDDGHDSRRRSMSPNGNDRYVAQVTIQPASRSLDDLATNSHSSAPIKNDNSNKDDEGAVNPGSNLFVTGIHPRLEESEITRLFEKYGEVEKCQIMKDPHSGESRGFGFVKMVTSDMADAAIEGLRGEVIEGRTLNIEKARRVRPRTPTPGKYFGPPKRGEFTPQSLPPCLPACLGLGLKVD